MDKLHEKGIVTYAAHLKGKGFYDEEFYKGPTAFLIGNEGNGLTDELSEKSKTIYQNSDGRTVGILKCCGGSCDSYV